MPRMLRCLFVGLVVINSLRIPLAAGAPLVQIDPQVRDRVVPAIVEIAIMVDATENGRQSPRMCPWAAARLSRRTG